MCLLLAVLLMACNNDKVYDEFVHTPIAGWEKNDTLSFCIPTLEEGGRYSLSLQMRTDNSFPFKSVVLVVEQTVFPEGGTNVTTLDCKLADNHGVSLGKGINIYQYVFDVNEKSYAKGDSIRVTVRHNMKREMLPGVSDVGLVLRKAKAL